MKKGKNVDFKKSFISIKMRKSGSLLIRNVKRTLQMFINIYIFFLSILYISKCMYVFLYTICIYTHTQTLYMYILSIYTILYLFRNCIYILYIYIYIYILCIYVYIQYTLHTYKLYIGTCAHAHTHLHTGLLHH